MPYYVKVTKQVRDAILPANIPVTRTFDGNYLVWQAAMSKVEGATLSDRAKKVGGALLNMVESKQEIEGTLCKECHTPEEYAGKAVGADGADVSEAPDGEESPSESQENMEYTQGVRTPEVKGKEAEDE